MKIGIFDSGIGGVTVLHTALRLLPTPEYLFYADTGNAPYGTKTSAEVEGFADGIVRFFLAQGAEAVVIACNTATSVAAASLRKTYDLPIVGMEPAVKPALHLPAKRAVLPQNGEARTAGDPGAVTGDRVLVLATPLTLREEKLKNLLTRVDTEKRVDVLALPQLVTFAEEGRFEDASVTDYLTQALSPYDPADYCAVVPGCTHFLYFLPQLKNLFPEGTAFVDGNEGTIRQLAHVTGLACGETPLTKERLLEAAKERVTFYASGVPEPAEKREAYYALLSRYHAVQERFHSAV